MSLVAIWMDRDLAKLFRFSAEEMERKTIHCHHIEHHSHPVDNIERDRREQPFFSQVAEQLGTLDRLLILGPGVAKHHFQNFLNEQFPTLAKKIVGCESMDHPTDQQIAAAARKLLFSPKTAAGTV